jgi:hypothetical protein
VTGDTETIELQVLFHGVLGKPSNDELPTSNWGGLADRVGLLLVSHAERKGRPLQ